MSNAGHTDVMSVLTTVPKGHVCHWTMKDALAPVHLQLSTEHIVVFQKKRRDSHWRNWFQAISFTQCQTDTKKAQCI